MARKLIATVVGVVGTVKVYRDAEWDEYVAKPMWLDHIDPETGMRTDAPDYFTNDKADALSTAREMAGPEGAQ